VHREDPDSQAREGDPLPVRRERRRFRGVLALRQLLEALPRERDPEDLVDPEPARVGGEQDPLRLRRRPFALSRRSGDRRQADHDAEHGDETTRAADRSGAPRTCGATLHLAPPVSRSTIGLQSNTVGIGHLGMLFAHGAVARAHQARSLPRGVRRGRRRRDRRARRHERSREHGDDGHAGTLPTRTTGPWAPITVARPAVPVIGGGIPVDIDPVVARTDLSTTLSPLPGKNRYQITVSNTSNVGAINSFQWYPPTGVHIV